MFKNTIRALVVGALLAPTASHAAEPYPQRAVRMIVGFAAGGPTDQAARIVAEAMATPLGQPVVVENRPGANSTIAARALVSSQPDGYSLLLASNGILTVAGARYKSLPFDIERDFVPIGSVAGYSHILVMPPAKAVPDLKTLIANAKSAKLPMTIASVGNVDDLSIALFRKLTGVQFDIIPYPGQSAVLSDLIAGRIDMSFLAPTVAGPLIESGKLKAIAVSGRSRLEVLPNVPTMEEAGVPGFVLEIWNALMAPTGTDPAKIATLSKALRTALAEKSVKEKLAHSGLVPLPDTPEELALKLKTEGQEWKQLATEEKLPLRDL